MNTISKQNSSESIDMLAAQRMMYSYAKRATGVGLSINLILMPTLTVLSIYNQDFAAYIATFSLLVLIYNALSFIYVKKRVKSAASVQELFDSSVLNIPLNPLIVDDADISEDIEIWSRKYFKHHTDTSLKDWYAPKLKKYNQLKATLTGQRINSWWDGTLRGTYSFGLVLFLVIIPFFVVILGLMQKLTLEAFILSVFVPIVPVIQTFITEYYKNYQASTNVARNLSRAKELLRKANNGTVQDADIRALQDSIYNHRISAPLVFDWVYWISRKSNEITMNKTSR